MEGKKNYSGNLKIDRLKRIVIWMTLLLMVPGIKAQQQEDTGFTEYKGVVMDAKSNKVLEFATINLMNSNISTISNIDGAFLLKVPNELKQDNVVISYLGYKTQTVPLSSFGRGEMVIRMTEAFESLPDVNLVEADPVKVIQKVIDRRRANAFKEPLIVKAFYRESIQKRKTYASLAEAVIDVYKEPLSSSKKDYVKLDRARKSTDYRKIDTLVIKLQGGPYNNLNMDMIRNEDLFFTSDIFEIYTFTFDKMINMDNKNVYVIDFIQKPTMVEPFYKGRLYIDAVSYALVKSVFSLNLENLNKVKRFFVKKKPPNADVIPTSTKYIVDYRETKGQWHYNYSRIELSFKVDWDKKWFNSLYNITIEMAVTDWGVNDQNLTVKSRERMRRSIILADEASGFSDPEFWGERNVIEPDKSIENAIKKIQRNLSK
jgi:hypothetical protein